MATVVDIISVIINRAMWFRGFIIKVRFDSL